MAAVRAAPVLLADTVNVTVPDPMPLIPPVSDSQAAPLVATHGQPAEAVTPIDPTPPVAEND
jgi:hypothetical protein